jgi:hypothetical protein
MLVKFVSSVPFRFEFIGCLVLMIATGIPTGFTYCYFSAATLITELARLVSFLSVSDSSVKVV